MTRFVIPRRPSVAGTSPSQAVLLEAARKAVQRTAGRGALGVIRPEDHALLITPPPPLQNAEVVAAILEALKERGLSVDAVDECEIGARAPLPRPMPVVSAIDGWKEVLWRRQNYTRLHESVSRDLPPITGGITDFDYAAIRAFLDGHPTYNLIFAGQGGRSQLAGYLGPDYRQKFRDNWVYVETEDLLGKYSGFPGELIGLIEKKTLENIPRFQDVVVRDRQGTHLRFSVTPEEARLWSESALRSGHLLLYPLFARTSHFAMGRDPHEIVVAPRVQGVVAGTGNHVGYFPHMQAYVKDGVVDRIEGGGLFGDLLRELLAATKDFHYPRYPLPGYFYFNEAALGTNPKAFRANPFHSYVLFANRSERARSGVIHWGFGIHSIAPDTLEFAKQHDLPFEHGWHIHTYFNTYDARLRDTGRWIRLIEDGHMTALDDPEVRSLASRYGDPDDLLSEEWVPAIPGINYPGHYMNDYGLNPAAWIWMEEQNQLPPTVGVPS